MKILVVDDNKDIRYTFESILSFAGEYTVVCAENGKQALALVEKETPDLIFSDIHMPVMGGMEFFKMLVQSRPDLKEKIVFMSGDWTDAVEDFIRTVGAKFLKKPFDFEDVLEVLGA